ncbi:MAG: phage tail assembly chaperone [Gammaproteobacteria bacterium]|nr:phage tail assembly chaperone [Gammaproteobacteria bacterium]
MIYLHYSEDDGKFLGWFDDRICDKIPEPNKVISDKDHLKYHELISDKEQMIFVVNDKIIVKKAEQIIDWLDIRLQRNKLLNETDWSQLGDVQPELREKYAIYRQTLRDIPQNFNSPYDVKWPVRPE